MTGLLTIVGSKIIRVIVIALAVGSILFITIQSIQRAEKEKVLKDVRIEVLEQEIEIREEVKDGIQDSREANPDRSGSIALDRLRERQNSGQ